jgi:hypothetical protein
MRSGFLFVLVFAMALNQAVCGSDRNAAGDDPSERRSEPFVGQANSMRIRLTVNGKTLSASLIDSATTRDFISLLPLTLAMNDLFGREKFAHLPRAISEGGERRRTYEIGELIYWSPGADIAIYYRNDGQPIPAPGVIVIAKIDSGVEALDMPGSVTVTIEAD